MKSLSASISSVTPIDRRRSLRWRVELHVSLELAPGQARATVRNLSKDGMLIETGADLQVGDSILVDLPEADETEARIVWRHDRSYGCAFDTPTPSAVISAALLKAPLGDSARQLRELPCEEFPVAVSPSLDELANWKANFESTWGEKGYRIIAYRQADNGLAIAIATRPDMD